MSWHGGHAEGAAGIPSGGGGAGGRVEGAKAKAGRSTARHGSRAEGGREPAEARRHALPSTNEYQDSGTLVATARAPRDCPRRQSRRGWGCGARRRAAAWAPPPLLQTRPGTPGGARAEGVPRFSWHKERKRLYTCIETFAYCNTCILIYTYIFVCVCVCTYTHTQTYICISM